MRKPPIIAISGATKLPGRKDLMTTAKSIGATRTLEKPFGETTLLRSVMELTRYKT